MKQAGFRINWLTLFILIAPALRTADFVLTLWRQPVEYWDNNFFLGTDGNPIIHFLLTSHPALFAAGYVFYVIFALWMLLISNRSFKIILAAGLIIDHGAAVFLADIFILGQVPYLIITAMTFLPPLLLFIGLMIFWRSKLKSPDSS